MTAEKNKNIVGLARIEDDGAACAEFCFNPAAVDYVQKEMLSEKESALLANTFKVLSSKTRIRILHALSLQELCICDLSVALDLSISATSHQLRLLKAVRLVKYHRDGKNVYYSLDDEHVVSLFARWYTPLVVLLTLLPAILPPLIIPGATFDTWLYRALTLLIISCPCALFVSVPLGYFSGLGTASRQGILIKGANFLKTLTIIHTIIFDKTGTLTEGHFQVKNICSANGFTLQEVLALAARAEARSNHPIARFIQKAFRAETSGKTPEKAGDTFQEVGTDYREIEGRGVKFTAGRKTILAGSARLLQKEGLQINI